MRFSTASEWFAWIETLHPEEMELGLERIRTVARRLSVLSPTCPVIIVGGTNGKGTTVATLESIYRAGGYRVGSFTSPKLFKHNEQIRINGCEASDEMFCESFEKVADALQGIQPTFFEFFTLAALLIFKQHRLDVLILEVGLGGRLDAVNIIDADVSIVTNISIDHVDWLGDTREKIGYEKAGIFRAGKPAICGDPDPPRSLVDYAEEIGAELYLTKFVPVPVCVPEKTGTGTHTGAGTKKLAPLSGINATVALEAITLLQPFLPISKDSIDKGLETVFIPGRIQIENNPITTIYDVSHNPASAALLLKKLSEMPTTGKRHAVFSMLGDKDIVETLNAIKNQIEEWHVAPLAVKRAASQKMLEEAFQRAGITAVSFYPDIQAAHQKAKQATTEGDFLVIFGSFHVVAETMPQK